MSVSGEAGDFVRRVGRSLKGFWGACIRRFYWILC